MLAKTGLHACKKLEQVSLFLDRICERCRLITVSITEMRRHMLLLTILVTVG